MCPNVLQDLLCYLIFGGVAQRLEQAAHNLLRFGGQQSEFACLLGACMRKCHSVGLAAITFSAAARMRLPASEKASATASHSCGSLSGGHPSRPTILSMVSSAMLLIDRNAHGIFSSPSHKRTWIDGVHRNPSGTTFRSLAICLRIFSSFSMVSAAITAPSPGQERLAPAPVR